MKHPITGRKLEVWECRYCYHLHWDFRSRCGGPYDDGDLGGGCECSPKQYAPSGNLEYMEWTYAKKSK